MVPVVSCVRFPFTVQNKMLSTGVFVPAGLKNALPGNLYTAKEPDRTREGVHSEDGLKCKDV